MSAIGSTIKAIFDFCFYGPFVLTAIFCVIIIPIKASSRTQEENRRAVSWLIGICIFWGGCAIAEAIWGALALLLCLVPLGLLAIGIAFVASPIISALMVCRAIDTWEKVDRAADDIRDMAERERWRH